MNEEDAPAPETEDNDADDGASYWFVGAVWDGTDDQMPRFLPDGIWENGWRERASFSISSAA
jgi:5-methylcytosine-specific restriction enzyme B